MSISLNADDFLPGTRRLYTDRDHQVEDSNVKKHGNIILTPQPTDHPDDPLSWSLRRKCWHGFLLLLITAVTGATTNDSGSTQFAQNEELGISYTSFNIGAGVLFIGIGYWTLLISPAVWLYGRRISYLICLGLGIIGAIWFARGEHTSDAIWNQLFVGASESCSEANVQLSLMDIFFQHQRGAVLGLYMLAISSGTFLSPLISGYIADNIGWRWVGYFGAISNGLLFIVFYFGLEETAFDRRRYQALEGISQETGAVKSKYQTRDIQAKFMPNMTNPNEIVREKIKADTSLDIQPTAKTGNGPSTVSSMPGKSYFQRIKPITLTPNVRGTGFKQYFKRLYHTLRVFTFPAVWYAGLQWGWQDACLTFYLTTEDDNWTVAPYNYTDVQLGNMNIPCLIGAVLGCAYSGYFSDAFVRWMARRNHNIQEAEHRLWMMLPASLIFPTGMLLFGFGSAYDWAWPGVYVGLGFIGFGWGNAGDLAMAYLEDCYPSMILEGMVGVAVINNTIGMIFTFSADPWLTADGTSNTYIGCGILSLIFFFTTWPMIYWGKACRRWTVSRYMMFVELRDGI